MKSLLIAELMKYNNRFSKNEIQKGISLFEKRKYKAKDIFLKAGTICRELFIADKSITRCYYTDTEGREHTLWMKPEQTFITEYKSFSSQTKSQFNLQFYEDTDVYSISRANLLKLYKESNNWALFGIYLTENTHSTLIDVFVNLLSNDATRNYQYIEYAFPRFIQVAPLKDIASMLQVSQVTLSRIRAGTQTKK